MTVMKSERTSTSVSEVAPPSTNLRAGRLRAWRFETVDAHQGEVSDPISLHKYLYANADPVIVKDPSGHDGFIDQLAVIGVVGVIQGITGGVTSAAFAKSGHRATAFFDGFARGSFLAVCPRRS